jgi:programmed cell death 6-interacting protein
VTFFVRKTRLTESVPSSTVTASGAKSGNLTQTQTHARALRVLLESLDDIKRSQTQLVDRAQRLAEVDDIRPRILQAASGLEQWVEVRPIMFEDALDEELAKYDKFIQGISESGQKQTDVLMAIRVRTIFAVNAPPF